MAASRVMRCLQVLSLISALTMSTRVVAQEAAPTEPVAAAPAAETPAQAVPSETPLPEPAPAAEPAPPPPPPPPPATAPAPAAPTENVLTTPPPPAAEEEEANKDESETDPMAWIGIGPKLGFIMPRLFGRVDRRVAVQYDAQPDTSLATMFGVDLSGAGSSALPVADTITTTEGGDTLFSIAVPINLGDGHGISLDLEPTIAFCVSCQKTRGDYTLIAAYAGLAYRFQPIDPLYVSIGLGLRPGIATVKDMLIATQGEARMPFTFTYYVHKSVGLVFEIAPGYGGYVDVFGDDLAESAMIANHALGSAEERTLTGGIPYKATSPVSGTANALSFAFGGSLDISIGARFP